MSKRFRMPSKKTPWEVLVIPRKNQNALAKSVRKSHKGLLARCCKRMMSKRFRMPSKKTPWEVLVIPRKNQDALAKSVRKSHKGLLAEKGLSDVCLSRCCSS